MLLERLRERTLGLDRTLVGLDRDLVGLDRDLVGLDRDLVGLDLERERDRYIFFSFLTFRKKLLFLFTNTCTHAINNFVFKKYKKINLRQRVTDVTSRASRTSRAFGFRCGSKWSVFGQVVALLVSATLH